MRKKLFFYFLAILFIPFLILATTVQAEKIMELKKETIYDVVTFEDIEIPAQYSLTVRNPNTYDDIFKIYTLLEADLKPEVSFQIEAGQEKTITVTLMPLEPLKERCKNRVCKIHYYFKAEKTGVIEDSFTIKIMSLEKIIRAKLPETISRDDSVLIFELNNWENINFGEIIFNFESDFGAVTENLTLTPDSSYTIEVDLDQLKLKISEAGNYEVKLKFLIKGKEYIITKTLKLEEFSSIVTTESTKFSFFGFTKLITKKNEGNVPKFIQVDVAKSRFEQAFTSTNIEPTSKEASGLVVIMKWQRELEPGETMNLEIHTDYTIPLIIVILIIIASLTIWLIKRPRVLIKKKAYRIKTKGGEFAIKIILFIKNVGSEIKNVKCNDTLPGMTKIYERFGAVKPDKIEKNRIMWNFGDLHPGEERIVSYIIYSRVIPVGTIIFPRATVSYTNIKDRRNIHYSNTLIVMGESIKT